jgi:hypothetical protein
MLRYLKNNGFPVDLEFQTDPYHSDDDDFHGWKSKIFVNGNYYKDLIHTEYRGRVSWATGFFDAYEWEATGKYKWRGKENTHRENGDLNVEVGDWIIDIDGYVRRVDMDSDPDMPYEIIKRHASEKEVENNDKINDLVAKLEKTKESNRSAWDTYGSELCAGGMIGEENYIEEQIEELRRNVSNTEI